MSTRKNTCYFPQENNKPFAVHHADYGIFSELRITNTGGDVVIAALRINDEFQPSVEIGGKKWFRPLEFPRKLRLGESLGAALQGPSVFLQPEGCYRGYPEKVEVLLTDGTAIVFGLGEIIRDVARPGGFL